MLTTFYKKANTYLFQEVNNSPLVLFRILFGLVMAMESFGAIATGWVKAVFIDTPYNFTFIDFDFLHVMHGQSMYYYYILMGLLGLCVTLGFLYRGSSFLMAVMWSGVYFAQKSHYNNHYYLMMILCWMMVIVPAHRRYALDLKLRLARASNTCARWCILMFCIQVTIVYTFAAIAKLNPDWLRAMPLGVWFNHKANTPYIGWIFGNRLFQYAISYFGILFDLLIVPALLWKKSRKLAVASMLFFHFFNSAVFGIGVFPYLAISLSVFFFPGNRFDNLVPLNKYAQIKQAAYSSIFKKVVIYGLGTYFIWQMYLPLRHHFIKGDVNWTEEGHRMAWRMMLRSKSGRSIYKVVDKKSKQTWYIDPQEHLTSDQLTDVASHPDMIWQFAQYLKEEYRAKGFDVAVYADCYSSLNGRPERLIVKRDVDLASVEWDSYKHSTWIFPYYGSDTVSKNHF